MKIMIGIRHPENPKANSKGWVFYEYINVCDGDIMEITDDDGCVVFVAIDKPTSKYGKAMLAELSDNYSSISSDWEDTDDPYEHL